MGGTRGQTIRRDDIILSSGQYAILRHEDRMTGFSPEVFPKVLNRGAILIADVRVRVKQTMKFRSEANADETHDVMDASPEGFKDPRAHVLRFERAFAVSESESNGRFGATPWVLTDINGMLDGNFPFTIED